MRKLTYWILCIGLIFLLKACGASEYEYIPNYIEYETETNETEVEADHEPEEEPEPLVEPDYTKEEYFPEPEHEVVTLSYDFSISIELAAHFFAQTQAIWDADDGDLWGVPLHMPLIFADSLTRHAVANVPDTRGVLQPYGGVYVGILPATVHIGATAIDWGGLSWGIMPWEWVEEDLGNETDVLRILVHEGFHALQDQVVHGPWVGNVPTHMICADNRISVLMELNALLEALRTDGDVRIAAITDAISIRAARRERYPDEIMNENTLEMGEGLAVFTDLILIRSAEERLESLEDFVGSFYNADISLFGYASGALYGLLLHDSGAEWRYGLTYGTDLGYLLQQAMGITRLLLLDEIDLYRYDYARLAPLQQAWVDNFIRVRDEGIEIMRTLPTVTLRGDWFIDWYITEYELGEALVADNFLLPPDASGWEGMVFYGVFVVYGTNYRLALTHGYFEMVHNPSGIRIGGAVDLEIDPDGRSALAPTWLLEITDENYMLEATDRANQPLRIVSR